MRDGQGSLARAWSFWACWSLRNECREIAQCKTLLQFWQCFRLVNVVDVPNTVSFHLFESGVDVRNFVAAGSYILLVPTSTVERMWMRLALAFAGEQLPEHQAFTGLSVFFSPAQSAVFQLWVKPGCESPAVSRVVEFLREALQNLEITQFRLRGYNQNSSGSIWRNAQDCRFFAW